MSFRHRPFVTLSFALQVDLDVRENFLSRRWNEIVCCDRAVSSKSKWDRSDDDACQFQILIISKCPKSNFTLTTTIQIDPNFVKSNWRTKRNSYVYVGCLDLTPFGHTPKFPLYCKLIVTYLNTLAGPLLRKSRCAALTLPPPRRQSLDSSSALKLV